MIRIALLTAVLCSGVTAGGLAQHPFATGGAYDPAVPTPRAVLGYELGTHFTPHHLLVRYAERVAAASRRVRLDTMAVTVEGRESLLFIVTSEANQSRWDQIRRDAALLADPGRAAAGEVETAVGRLPAIAWMAYTVHGGEASGTEAAIGLLYQLAAGTDPETRLVLDSTVVLIDPVQNPDGHERHAQDVRRARSPLGITPVPGSMVHQGSWPGPRTSHYYFDLNRDWFIHSHPETRGRIAAFLEWWPHVAVDLHEMGSNATYFFAPPMDPVNKNVHGTIFKWWDIFAEANASAFARQGWSFFRREGYDEFYPGYGVSWPILTGAVGMTYEQASSGGGAIRRTDGTVLTLHDAAWHHYTAAWATVTTTARRRTERLNDYLTFRRTAVSDPPIEGVRAVGLARDAEGRADSLVRVLLGNGIRVHRTAGVASARGTPYGASTVGTVELPAGSYVVDYAQPQGRLARALLEPDARLDSTFIREELERRRTAQPDRFYDVTAWSLPFAFRVRAWTLAAAPPGLERVSAVPAAEPPPPDRAGYAYAFAPGSEPSLRLLAQLLRDSVKVWFAPKGFRIGSASFPSGAFLVRVEPNGGMVHERVRLHAASSGATVAALATSAADEGADLGSNSVFFIRPVRVGLVGGPGVSGNAFGFAWFQFDQRLAYPVVPVTASSLGPAMLEQLDVIVLPSFQGSAFERELGAEAGRTRLADWVRNGGTLITMEGATAWLAQERTGLARIRVRQDSVRADSAGGAPLPASVPGAIVRATVDTLSPLLAGIRDTEIPVLVNGGTVLTVPRNLRAGEAVIRYAPVEQLRLSGYLWPEMPARLAGAPYLWTESVGRGRVIGFAGDPNFRDIWRGLFVLFGNAVLLGGSM